MNDEERDALIKYITGAAQKNDLTRGYWSPSTTSIFSEEFFPGEYKTTDAAGIEKTRKPSASKQIENLETRVNVEVADIRKEVETLRVLLIEGAITEFERKELNALRSEVNALKSEIQALRSEIKMTGYLSNALL